MLELLAKKLETIDGARLPLMEGDSTVVWRLTSGNMLSALAFLGIFSVTFSIAVSQIFLGLAVLCWLYILWRHPSMVGRPIAPLYLLAGFAVAAILSALMSPNPQYSLGYFRKFWLYSLLVIVPAAFRTTGRLERLYCWVAVGSAASALVAIFQYFFDPHITLVNRITGLTGHWMTFSGLQMLSLISTMSLLLSYRGREYRWVLPAVPLQIFSLVLCQTRSAWLGLVVGLLVLAFMISWRWVIGVGTASALSFFLLPVHFQSRLKAAFDLNDETTRIRLELLQTGLNMIEAHPFFGVGLKMVPQEYVHYNTTNEFPFWIYQHLHNDFIQIGAEVGLVGLAFWIAFLAVFVVHCIRIVARSDLSDPEKGAARAAVSCVAALLVAGLFEYNFGDSEVLTLFLFLLAAPYAGKEFTAKARRLKNEGWV
ncbi:MAG TPA: O-antigen ligase family protein [Acidobacteriota bacterium]|jgi:O-antigen ligase